jgi:hypothetical protein
MQLFVCLFVIGFLEDLIGADAYGFDGAKAFDIQGRGIDVDPADFTFLIFGVVNGLDGVGNKLRIVFWMLASDHDQTFVACFHQGFGLTYELFFRQGGPVTLFV